SDLPRPRRCGKATIHPRSLRKSARSIENQVSVNRRGLLPRTVDPRLITDRGKGPAPSGLKITASRRTGLPSSTRFVCKNSDLPRVHATTASGLVRDARSDFVIAAKLVLMPRSKLAFRPPSSAISYDAEKPLRLTVRMR